MTLRSWTLKSWLTFLTPALLSFLAISQPGQAQEIPPLQQEMPYGEARKLLLEAGWQASLRSPMQRSDSFGTEKYVVEKLGFNEVVACSGTGLGFCRFEFVTADNRKLVVITAGGQNLRLYRWQVEP